MTRPHLPLPPPAREHDHQTVPLAPEMDAVRSANRVAAGAAVAVGGLSPRTEVAFGHGARLWPRWFATRACALVWLLAGLYCAPALAASWTVEGRVIGVSDGDTLTVLDDAKVQHKIRIAAIDAPEKGQAFGARSKQALSALVFQKRVEVRCHKKDKYSREVCAVFVGFRDVGLEQIRSGLAWHYKEYQHEQTTQERLVYRDEEEAAKAARRGLWKDAKPVPPWEWRKAKTARP